MKDQINGYYLDKEQQAIVLDQSKYLLVIAGAGSGKTLTILGKIHYLIKYKKINPNEILCISFTKKAADSLKDKIKKEFDLDMPVYTFHKLSLEILKEKSNYDITDSNLLENMIHQFFEEELLAYDKQLKIVLEYFKIKVRKNIKNRYLDFYNSNKKEIMILEKLLLTFIHLLKCNNYSLQDFPVFLKQARKTFSFTRYKQEKRFLVLALNIYLMYENYLKENNEIDFDDMIIKAMNRVKDYGINKSYKYVIIDEYQDTSYIRFKLVKEILDKTNANLMVVGDDFQSIYRFTGCDLSLFLDFSNYFPASKTMKIQNTYRNSQQLIKIAGSFVMKNKKQIYKDLHSNQNLDYPIQIIYYDDIKKTFKELVLKIFHDTNTPILILGRNNKDINLVLDDNFKLEGDNVVYKKDSKIKLTYLTAHKSKGLEEENVIIINLENSLLGFPNQIKNDKVLRFVSKDYEKYPYSEERRLFYVALTRTKNYVYLLVPYKNQSIFIKELLKYKKIKVIK